MFYEPDDGPISFECRNTLFRRASPGASIGSDSRTHILASVPNLSARTSHPSRGKRLKPGVEIAPDLSIAPWVQRPTSIRGPDGAFQSSEQRRFNQVMQGAWKVGLLVVVFGVLLVAGFQFLGKSVFAQPTDEYYAELESVEGISEGTKVLMAGVPIGTPAINTFVPSEMPSTDSSSA